MSNYLHDPNWKDDFSFGKKYEQIVCYALNSKGVKCTLTEGKCDYDIISDKGNKIEVKTDRWIAETGNVCFELWSNKMFGTIGWLQKDIDYLAYVSVDENGDVLNISLYDLKAIQDVLLNLHFRGNTWEGTTFLRITNAKQNGNILVENILIHQSQLELFKIADLTKYVNTGVQE